MAELPADKDRRIKEETEEKNRDRVAMYYYRVFCTSEEGKYVLQDILSDLFYWTDKLENEEQVVLNNAARGLLKKMGLLENVSTAMDAMISVSKYRRKE